MAVLRRGQDYRPEMFARTTGIEIGAATEKSEFGSLQVPRNVYFVALRALHPGFDFTIGAAKDPDTMRVEIFAAASPYRGRKKAG